MARQGRSSLDVELRAAAGGRNFRHRLGPADYSLSMRFLLFP